MFGELPIFGNSEPKIDSKGRLFVPKFTRVEENDQLVIQKGKGNYFVIANCSLINEKIKQLKENNDDRKIEILTSSIVDMVRVDSQNRIIFRHHKNFAVNRKVFVHGNYDSIQVFPSQKDYENYIEQLKKNR